MSKEIPVVLARGETEVSLGLRVRRVFPAVLAREVQGEMPARQARPEIPGREAARVREDMRVRRVFRVFRVSAVILARRVIRAVKGQRETWVRRVRQVRLGHKGFRV